MALCDGYTETDDAMILPTPNINDVSVRKEVDGEVCELSSSPPDAPGEVKVNVGEDRAAMAKVMIVII